MQILLWVIFIGSLLSLITFLLSRMSSYSVLGEQKIKATPTLHPQPTWDYLTRELRIWGTKLWHFILEAKDLKPSVKLTGSIQKVKHAFRVHIRQHQDEPRWLPEVTADLSEGQTPEELHLKNIKQNPRDSKAYEHLGRLYLDEKRFAEAAEIYEYLTKLDPGQDSHCSNLGLTYYELRQYPQAVQAYEAALKLNDKISARWINLALTFAAMGELSRSIKSLTRAVDLDPRNPSYLMLLADYYAQARNPIRAEQVLSQILKWDPTNRPAREKLMKLRLKV